MDITKIHEKWQRSWSEAELGRAEVKEGQKKFFAIFAYPGISGFLHVGHMRGYSYTDMISRYKRMTGHNVLFPVGTHASGNLPFAFVKKLENKDAAWIDYLKRNGASDQDISGMNTPEGVVDFFNKEYVENSWKKFGFLIDDRRFTSTINEDYQKFIQWQFKKLRDANLLVQKPYFATFCPDCGPVAVDPSETDISKGGKAEKQEYTLLKFKFEDAFLVAATLRPETVFGQTNLWANPDATYVKVDVAGETWIMSAQAAEKLAYQKDDVMVVGEMLGRDLLGKTAIAPAIGRELPILPATFCDPDMGSGIVTCVPSDAPYDYVALRDLQENTKLMEQYDLDPKIAQDIELIPILKNKGFGEFPAKELVDKMGIKSQADTQKLEEATKELYKVGFHSGVMLENAGQYAGKKVVEAKELIKADLLASREADIFHDLSEEVICRCGVQVVIKRIDDQWFIKYSDEEVTQKAKECAQDMNIYPKDFSQNFGNILEWFSDRACTRLGKWVGTPLPFDERWIVEPIADSTLYPIYYLVSMYVNSGQLSSEDLTEEFFDYAFLGQGEAQNDVWKAVRQDVSYWYPLDVNLGGVDHRTVHFPVFVMNHVGILPEEMWPKGIIVNAWITGKGGKISKSKGGAQPIPGAIEKYGVDTMRMYYAHIGSPDSTIVWDEDHLVHYRQLLERLYKQCTFEVGPGNDRPIDDWLMSTLHSHVASITEALEAFDLREACTQIYFTLPEALKWYEKRGGDNGNVRKEYCKVLARMMMPFTPHLAEEMWEALGGSGLVSEASWPESDTEKVHGKFQAVEDMIQGTIKDIGAVKKLAQLEELSEVVLFVTPAWKSEVVKGVKHMFGQTRNMGEILKHVLNDSNREHGKAVSKIVQMAIKDPSKLPHFVMEHDDEYHALNDARDFLAEMFSCEIKIVKAEKSDEAKAQQAMPGKPAILVR